MNSHKHARLTYVRRTEMVRELTVDGLSTSEVASRFAVTAATVRKWLGRFLAGGDTALAAASSRPRRSPRAIDPAKALLLVELRQRSQLQARIAKTVGVSEATVSRVLAIAGLSKLSDLAPREPVQRYEHPAPGDLLHIDTKKLGRIERPSHRVTGNRRDSVEGAGWETLFVAIDDHARIAFTASLVLLGLLVSGAAWSGEADRPLAMAGGFEHWRLPGSERLGMAHAEVLFEAARDWWLGPTVHGAASGQRGGFFVGGLAIQRPIAIAPGLSLVPGLAFGGGGGGGAPVGDGLMLRPSLSLQVPFGPWRVGLGVSEVRFPGTPIRSSQIGVVAEWHDHFAAEPLARVGQRLSANGRSGLGFDRIALTAGRYALPGVAASPQVSLVGLRMDRFDSSNTVHWGLEAAAAANGSSAGYMEILVQAGAEIAWTESLRWGARAAVGLGGGGAVPTGGGTIGHLDATLQITPITGWHVAASIGRVAGTASAMRGTRAELSLATDVEPLGMPGTPGRSGPIKRIEWAGAGQQIHAVQRKAGTAESLQTIGLQLNSWLDPNVYLTGQAHSALGGKAGAYSQGLLGAGIATEATGAWGQIGAELLAGAAGGGGVQSLSGAIAQAMLWFGWMPGRDGPHVRLAVGVQTAHSGSSSPVVALSWAVPFGQIVR